jgi:hypothetical protein
VDELKLTIASNALGNIEEIWAYGENAIMVCLKNNKKFRATAVRNIYSGNQYKFAAFYEEEIAVKAGDVSHFIWAAANLTSEGGETVEYCLENALRYLNAIEA